MLFVSMDESSVNVEFVWSVLIDGWSLFFAWIVEMLLVLEGSSMGEPPIVVGDSVASTVAVLESKDCNLCSGINLRVPRIRGHSDAWMGDSSDALCPGCGLTDSVCEVCLRLGARWRPGCLPVACRSCGSSTG